MKRRTTGQEPSMAKIRRSVGRGAFAVISVGIEASRTPTFVYCVVILVILWVVGLLFAWQPLEAWATLSKWTTMMTMCLVLGMITLLSLLPVAVYAAFDRREKLHARRHIVFELKHYKLYNDLGKEVGTRFDDLYNDKSYRVPVPLATLALVVGWVLFFFSEGAGPVANLAGSGNISDLFVNLKNAHPVVFGFLGAFFFSLRMLFQRYVTTDLKASVFMHIAVRIWVVMILTLVLSVVWYALPALESYGYQGSLTLLAVCFIAGISPDVALNLIERVVRAGFGKLGPRAYAHVPLAKIRGLNLWHQARLAEEGIDSVQNLAMGDIVGLIVNTRLGLMRLLHWIDQAILIVHVGVENLEKFNKAGIHTATDFEAVYVGQLAEDEQMKFREREVELESYMGRKGLSYVPEVPQELLKSLREAELEERGRNGLIKASEKEEGLKERVRNMMIAICDDVNYQRLWKIRHGKPIYGKRE